VGGDVDVISTVGVVERGAEAGCWAGGVAGMVAKSVVAPVDRVKILFQVSSEGFSIGRMRHIMSRIVEEEGIRGLWKGNSATMLRCEGPRVSYTKAVKGVREPVL
jgi:hypothetical protein